MENVNTKKKDIVKEKVFLLLIGILVGAVISTTAFFVYLKLGFNNNTNSSMQQIPGGTPPQLPGNMNGQSNQNNTPPEIPNNNTNTSQDNNQQ